MDMNAMKAAVLILVLMEDTLREPQLSNDRKELHCLNPCFNGRYSQRASKSIKDEKVKS